MESKRATITVLAKMSGDSIQGVLWHVRYLEEHDIIVKNKARQYEISTEWLPILNKYLGEKNNA